MNLISELSSFLAAKKELQIVISNYNENFLEMILGRFCPNLRIKNCEKIEIFLWKKEIEQKNNVWNIEFTNTEYDSHEDLNYNVTLCHLVVTEELLLDFIKSSIEILKCSI